MRREDLLVEAEEMVNFGWPDIMFRITSLFINQRSDFFVLHAHTKHVDRWSWDRCANIVLTLTVQIGWLQDMVLRISDGAEHVAVRHGHCDVLHESPMLR
jgi:hypothetical protein